MAPLYLEVAPGYETNCRILDEGVTPVTVINNGDKKKGTVMMEGKMKGEWEGGVSEDGGSAFVNFSDGGEILDQVKLGEKESVWETWVGMFPWLTLVLEP